MRLSFMLHGSTYLGLARDELKCLADAGADITELHLIELPNALCHMGFTAIVPGTEQNALNCLQDVWSVARPPEPTTVTTAAEQQVKGKLLLARSTPGSGRLIRLVNAIPPGAEILDIEVRRVSQNGRRVDHTKIRFDESAITRARWAKFTDDLTAEHGKNGIIRTQLCDCTDDFLWGSA